MLYSTKYVSFILQEMCFLLGGGGGERGGAMGCEVQSDSIVESYFIIHFYFISQTLIVYSFSRYLGSVLQFSEKA
jgi:hypothetical protein